MPQLRIESKNLDRLYDRFRNAEQIWRAIVEPELRTLGGKMVEAMRVELKPVHYTGKLEESVRYVTEVKGKRIEMTVGPTAEHRFFVRYGTRPHWAPIAPLKAWAAVKLGDENAAYAVQRSIATHGTSMWAVGLYGSKENDFYTRTLTRTDVTSAKREFLQRVNDRLKKKVERG